MLVEFRVGNHRSLRDEQVLTMEAGKGFDPKDPRPRKVKGWRKPLLPVVALYGANASGKSNVLAALRYMQDMVAYSHYHLGPEQGVPQDSFAWGPDKQKPSLYEATFIVNGTRYEYGFEVANGVFSEEWLFAWPKGKKQTWLERDGMKFGYGDHFKGENKTIERVTRPNALFLSVAAQHGHPSLSVINLWLRSLYIPRVGPSVLGQMFDVHPLSELALFISRRMSQHEQTGPMAELVKTEMELFQRFRSLIQSSDVGIIDIELRTDHGDTAREGQRKLMVQHQNQNQGGNAWLPIEQESQGTQTLFRIGIPIVRALVNGGVLVADELEASLHPMLAQQIIAQFNHPSTNPKNAQLIFTTHDTNLLGPVDGEPTLRRDQVWFTEKDQDGATVLYPLTDYKPRKAENLERGYLQGRYGAIPFLGQFHLNGVAQNGAS